MNTSATANSGNAFWVIVEAILAFGAGQAHTQPNRTNSQKGNRQEKTDVVKAFLGLEDMSLILCPYLDNV
jgi:hypothetical protein